MDITFPLNPAFSAEARLATRRRGNICRADESLNAGWLASGFVSPFSSVPGGTWMARVSDPAINRMGYFLSPSGLGWVGRQAVGDELECDLKRVRKHDGQRFHRFDKMTKCRSGVFEI
jgi:hypothetical protein